MTPTPIVQNGRAVAKALTPYFGTQDQSLTHALLLECESRGILITDPALQLILHTVGCGMVAGALIALKNRDAILQDPAIQEALAVIPIIKAG